MSDNVQPLGDNRFLGLKSVIEKRKERDLGRKPLRKKKQDQEPDDRAQSADKNAETEHDTPQVDGDGSLLDIEI